MQRSAGGLVPPIYSASVTDDRLRLTSTADRAENPTTRTTVRPSDRVTYRLGGCSKRRSAAGPSVRERTASTIIVIHRGASSPNDARGDRSVERQALLVVANRDSVSLGAHRPGSEAPCGLWPARRRGNPHPGFKWRLRDRLAGLVLRRGERGVRTSPLTRRAYGAPHRLRGGPCP